MYAVRVGGFGRRLYFSMAEDHDKALEFGVKRPQDTIRASNMTVLLEALSATSRNPARAHTIAVQMRCGVLCASETDCVP